jgi:hypothetical protein
MWVRKIQIVGQWMKTKISLKKLKSKNVEKAGNLWTNFELVKMDEIWES